MANPSPSPEKYGSTYKKVRLPFVSTIQQREGHSTDKDLYTVNFMQEKHKDPITEESRYYLIKRPGTIELNSLIGAGTVPATPTGEGRGICLWDRNYYSVFGNKLYRNATEIKTLATSTGKCGFVVATGATQYLFFCDGTNAYYISTAGTVNDCTGEPTPHVPTPVFVDGYIFLAKANTADIYNCVLETPGTWNASDFITAEMFPDNIVALARQNNQVVALGKTSTQFFYDAGNATGTPLAVTPNTAIQFGCANYESVTQAEQLLTWVSISETGGRAVWVLDGFEAKKISNETVERFISIYQSTPKIAMNIRINGHFLYLLNNIDGYRTLVYDYDEKTWNVWGSLSGSDNVQFAYVHSTPDDGYGSNVLQGLNNQTIVQIYQRMFTDSGTNILCTYRTENIDLGNDDRKFMYSMKVLGQKVFYGGNGYNSNAKATSCSISFRYNDEDYDSDTWSSWKTIDLVTQPFFKRLGSFRNRAFEFKFTEQYPLRLEGIEIDYNQGIN